MLVAIPARSPQLSHAACASNLPASKPTSAFQTAKVIAAILRAIITRANSGRSSRASTDVFEVKTNWLDNGSCDLTDSLYMLTDRVKLPSFDRDAVSLLPAAIAQLSERMELLESKRGQPGSWPRESGSHVCAAPLQLYGDPWHARASPYQFSLTRVSTGTGRRRDRAGLRTPRKPARVASRGRSAP